MIEKAQERGLKIVVKNNTPTDKYALLLDTQADESLIHPSFSSNLSTTMEKVTIIEISGDSFEVNQEIDLCGFLHVHHQIRQQQLCYHGLMSKMLF